MRKTNRANQAIIQASKEQRCLYATTKSGHMALIRRMQANTLIRPYRGLYVERERWAQLDPVDRQLHILRALGRRYRHWTFAGLSAAALHQLDYPWFLHDDQNIYIATANTSAQRGNKQLHRIYMNPVERHAVGDLFATSPARTLVDCALRYRFREVLPMFDSALRRQLASPQQILDVCAAIRCDMEAIRLLLSHANANSENGGESFVHGTIIESGFADPSLQEEFIDPDNPHRIYRADFVWRLHDGRIIVAEFDGMEKYVNPTMTGGRSIRAVVSDEKQREEALRRADVTVIVRLTYEDALHRAPLIAKLMAAGVPRMTGDRYRYDILPA